MNELSQKLNEDLKMENPYVEQMLSNLGKNLYYPKGILTQASEATEKAYKYNATIGIATEKGEPMHFQHIQEGLSAYSPSDLYNYAPPAGKEDLRIEWKKKIFSENPSLKDKEISTPIVTNALTHGLSVAADLFIDEGDSLILPDKYWGNYNFIFGIRRNAKIETYNLFNEDNKFNTTGLSNLIAKQEKKVILLLNFPNNPTGYTPSEKEANEVVNIIKDAALSGKNIIVIIDDAYFSLFYENSIKESIFSRIANIHERVLCVKIDGATKENYAWGFRVGFITYATDNKKVLNILEQKTKGIIRGTISSSSHPSQTFILKAMKSHQYQEQQLLKYNIMKNRAQRVKSILDNNKKFEEVWSFYPFNSGYFMCLKLKKINAEELRKSLLENRGIGTIAINKTDLRVAFSCVEEIDIDNLFEEIYQEAKKIQNRIYS